MGGKKAFEIFFYLKSRLNYAFGPQLTINIILVP